VKIRYSYSSKILK